MLTWTKHSGPFVEKYSVTRYNRTVMEYKRINDYTINCIVTKQDMENFGLNLDEIFNHTKKSDEFLHHIVDEAKEELGYQLGGMLSMRIELLQNEDLSITFHSQKAEDLPPALQLIRDNVLKKLREAFPDGDVHMMEEVLNQLTALGMGDTDKKSLEPPKQPSLPKAAKKAVKEEKALEERMVEFSSMQSLMEFCKMCGLRQPVRSSLYKWNGSYYLLFDNYRVSKERFNKMTASAFDFGTVHAEESKRFEIVKDQGEVLIDEKAMTRLRKLG